MINNNFNGNPSYNIQKNTPKVVKTRFFYINDLHGQVPNMERIKTASDTFERTKSPEMDNFKLCAGDSNIGSNEKINNLANVTNNSLNLDGAVLGNHEYDPGQKGLENFEKDANFKILATNVNIPKTNPLSNSTKITKSTIINKNGNNYGLIGISPTDLNERLKKGTDIGGITVSNKEKTKKEILDQVENFKKQGINKIILISHGGYVFDKEVAKSISGIDVIIGGHSHDLLKDFKTQNLFYSPSNEPVVITQAGRDGDNYGVLDATFDENGVIKECSNQVLETEDAPKSLIIDAIANKIQGPPELLGVIGYAEKPQANRLITENPAGSFVCDAMRKAAGTDIALTNSGNLRGKLSKGSVSSRDIESLLPFKDDLFKLKLSEKDLVEALNDCAKCMTSPMNKPGILQVSGVKYSMTRDGKLKDAFVQKNGQYKQIDINNPSTEKTITACCNGYLVNCPEGFKSLGYKENMAEKIGLTNIEATKNHIKSYQNKPFDIKTENRITTV